MAIDRKRFLALLAIGIPAMVAGKRLGILARLKSYFSALRGASLTAENIPKIAWELHHGICQSLAAIAMQMDVLRRQSLAQGSPLASELWRIQGFVHEEFLKYRELRSLYGKSLCP